jgi:16S rRNA (adenine1518-N6/adenine1519-N6)-dimethyltransferase
VASPSNKFSSSYSALSVFINYLAKTKIALRVPSQVFVPSPSVNGVLIIIEPFRNANVPKEYLSSFLHFLKNCFRFRRKTLLNNLLGFAGNHKKE